jgi:protein-disulfide isomerase
MRSAAALAAAGLAGRAAQAPTPHRPPSRLAPGRSSCCARTWRAPASWARSTRSAHAHARPVRSPRRHRLFYTTPTHYLLQGQLIDTKAAQPDRGTAGQAAGGDFDTLPFKDSFTIVRGNGKRKLAVFEDPNCGYCKRFERDLQKVDNVTVYMYLYPILGPDSTDKSRNIWCAKDKAKAWQDWMVRERGPPRPTQPATCTALDRNVEFGKKHKITGTPDADLRRRHAGAGRHRRRRHREDAGRGK